jgi:hypothetical protein
MLPPKMLVATKDVGRTAWHAAHAARRGDPDDAADGMLMPVRKNQPPPDMRYFKAWTK